LSTAIETTLRPVPFFDGGPMHRELKSALLGEIADLIDSGRFANGPQIAELEAAFADYCGTSICVGLASGLDALRLGLLAAGLEPGEEVIVPAQTFIATFEAVSQAGGVPVPVDVRDDDYGLDAEAAAAAVTGRTRFLMPVHLYGQLTDLAALEEVAERYGLEIFEDACQAHGAERDGRRAGAAGRASAFSFYPAKNLGAMGDAGALVTNDEALAASVRALREHGQARKYHHVAIGFTSRLDTVQALFLLHKLRRLDEWNEERRAAARYYAANLAGVGDLQLPAVPKGSNPVWHLYVVRTPQPERLADYLDTQGISTGRHYPEPPHLSAAYADLGYGQGDFPVAETISRECLSLPIFPGITEEQLGRVVEAVKAFFAD
jgi:dTDP-4-amino-4,6-dideoxygalactose transaminase